MTWSYKRILKMFQVPGLRVELADLPLTEFTVSFLMAQLIKSQLETKRKQRREEEFAKKQAAAAEKVGFFPWERKGNLLQNSKAGELIEKKNMNKVEINVDAWNGKCRMIVLKIKKTKFAGNVHEMCKFCQIYIG